MTSRCHVKCPKYVRAECTWVKAQKRKECERMIRAKPRRSLNGGALHGN
jgi:hypothetical protein